MPIFGAAPEAAMRRWCCLLCVSLLACADDVRREISPLAGGDGRPVEAIVRLRAQPIVVDDGAAAAVALEAEGLPCDTPVATLDGLPLAIDRDGAATLARADVARLWQRHPEALQPPGGAIFSADLAWHCDEPGRSDDTLLDAIVELKPPAVKPLWQPFVIDDRADPQRLYLVVESAPCSAPVATLGDVSLVHDTHDVYTLAPAEAARLFAGHPEALSGCAPVPLVLPLTWRCDEPDRAVVARTDVHVVLRPAMELGAGIPGDFRAVGAPPLVDHDASPYPVVSIVSKPPIDPATLGGVTLGGAPVTAWAPHGGWPAPGSTLPLGFRLTPRTPPLAPGFATLHIPTGPSGVRRLDGACLPAGLVPDMAVFVREQPLMKLQLTEGNANSLWFEPEPVGADVVVLEERDASAEGEWRPATTWRFECADGEVSHRVYRARAELLTGGEITSEEVGVDCPRAR